MKLPQNLGDIDRLIRALVAVILFYGSYLWLSGTAQLVGYIIAIIVVLTAATGYCGLYTLMKWDTNKPKSKSKGKK